MSITKRLDAHPGLGHGEPPEPSPEGMITHRVDSKGQPFKFMFSPLYGCFLSYREYLPLNIWLQIEKYLRKLSRTSPFHFYVGGVDKDVDLNEPEIGEGVYSYEIPLCRGIRSMRGENVYNRRSLPCAVDVIVFDMDGTLITESSWDLLHAYFKADRDRVESNKEAYFSGAIDYETWMEKDISLWNSPTMDDIRNALTSFTLEPFAQEVVSQLKKRGMTPCIVSAGVDILAEMVGLKVGVDPELVFANTITVEGKALRGVCRVEPYRKDEVVQHLSHKLGIPLGRFAAVGDAAPDISLFKEVALKFAYRPKDPFIVEAADAAIEDLRELLTFFPE